MDTDDYNTYYVGSLEGRIPIEGDYCTSCGLDWVFDFGDFVVEGATEYIPTDIEHECEGGL